ncbi:ABC transporter ATP-binding protein [Peptoniphilaceae bacterium SGI.131]
MIISIKNVVKRYKDLVALDNFSLDIEKGEILGLLGPNGSGKTTLINCMLALLSHNSGNIEIFDREMTPNRLDAKARIGLVPQEIAVFETLTVRENVDYFCSLYIKDSAKRKILVNEAIKFVELEKFEKFTPKKLSGGLLRRLNLACGIAHKPDILLLDEPTVAVDAQARNFILNGLKELNKQGVTIIYTTHYLEEVEELCTKIVIMDKGKKLAEGTKEDLKNSINTREIIKIKPIDDKRDFSKDFEGLNNILSVKKENDEYILDFSGHNNNLSYVVEFLSNNKIAYSYLHNQEPSLNEVFLALTGKELRE